MTDELAAV